MKPETVLNLTTGGDPIKLCDEWLREYKSYADEFTNTEYLAGILSDRVKRACELILERSDREPATSHDEAFYEELDRTRAAEDASLDGDFPLGNEQDALFAGTYFPIPDLVSIQLGYKNLVDCGYYTEYNYPVLARRGFIAEQNGEWLEAARCYEGVSGSETVQNREYECRRKAKAEGENKYAEAQSYMQSGQWSRVFAPLERASDLGNTDAMTDLALARIYGQYDCAKDIDEALRLLRTAAKAGDTRAAFTFCELYDSGIKIDAHEAMAMCEKAAEAGDERAKVRLADGFDLRPLCEILLEQIEKGNIDAIWMMYKEYEHTNDTEAAKWYDKAIEAGQVDALLSAAELFADEDGDEYSETQANNYYRRAADAGSVEAIIALGNRELKDTSEPFWAVAMKLKDMDEPVNPPAENIRDQHKKQLAWYRLAAESGDTEAMNAMCVACHLGYPLQRNDSEAFLWASRAADAGDAVAMYQTAYLYENGYGVDKDLDAAILLYTESAEKGIASSMIRLYQIYSQGFEHIPVNPEKAAHYLFLSGECRD